MKLSTKVLLTFIILWMFVLLADVIIFFAKLLSTEDPSSALDSPAVVVLILYGALGPLLVALVGLWGIVSKQAARNKQVVFLTIASLLASLLIGSLLLIHSHPQEVTFTARGFEPAQVTIVQGGGFLVANRTAISQTLCLRSHHRCDHRQQTPPALEFPGLVLLPGQAVWVEFSNTGTYQVTSLSPPARVDLTVEVGEPYDPPDMPCETSC